MKKIYILAGSLLITQLTQAQIRTNQKVGENLVPNSTAFLDASSSTTWNGSINIGKGLVFPRTNLVTLTTLVQSGPNVANNFPTRMDGMIVYNTEQGISGIGNVEVNPGFYYYENKTNNLNGGTWKPLANNVVGKDGKTLRHGTGAPSNTLGNIDDFYIDTQSQKLYGPKTNSGWGTGVSIIGPKGDKGDTGAVGPAGPQGPKGNTGATGAQGPSGVVNATRGITYDANSKTVSLPAGANGQVLKWNGTAWAPASDDNSNTNIYTNDGTLASNRTVTMGNKTLKFTGGLTTFEANSYYPLTINSTNANGGGLALVTNGDATKRVELSVKQDGNFRLWANGDRMTIDRTTGNVGIGTSDPSEKLHVQGNVRVSSLAGNGNRVVMADANGILKTGDASSLGKTYSAGTGIEISNSNVISTKSPVSTKTSNYTLATTDNGGYVYINTSGASTVTIPSGLPAGFSCVVVQQGTGQVTVVGSGVSLLTARGTKTRTQHSAIGVIKRTNNEATITGDAIK
ncbi:collagen-like triple helix repeat-containing protein [Riemerella columbina]|uniref:collagen-like triple helix repeat-containing protein n=1 Tax=Riemerella columbina TaxID=103810 RepID=UPI000377503E|nr:collagen-like protein [Riemerella columbina]